MKDIFKKNLGRLLIVCTVFMLISSNMMIFSAVSKNNNTSLSQYCANESKYSIEAMNRGESIYVQFNLESFLSENILIEDKEYSIFSFEDAAFLYEEGYPQLPSISKSVIIPDDVQMKIEMLDFNFETFDNVLIAPSKGHILRSTDPNTIQYKFNEIYEKDEWYPKESVVLNEPYIIRDFRGQVVQFLPLQYNPYQKQLRVYTNINVKIIPESMGKINVLERVEPITSLNDEFQSIYSRHFINYDTINYNSLNFAFNGWPTNKLSYTPVDDQGNMLIITYDNFYDEIKEYANWKNMKGIPTTVVNLSEIGSSANDIKNYISGFYNDFGLTFVLLVGDIDQIPSLTSGGSASDPSYSYIVGNDHYPDIFVGRFSAQNTNHLQTQIDRSISYEKNPSASADWYHKGVGIASSQGGGSQGDDGEADWQHMRNIRSDLLSYSYTLVDELYDGSQGGGDASGNPYDSDVTTSVNDGRGVINYCGHGSASSWGTSGFSSSDVHALVNNNMLPFIWSVACVNGQFDDYSECFAEAWLRATNNGNPTGAIATLMSSKNQAWDPPMDAQDEMNDILIESYSNNEKTTFGGISFNGCMHMNDEYGSAGFDEMDCWHIFGDPSIEVRTDTPSYLSVSHEDSMALGDTSYEVFVNGGSGALCAISRNGVLLGYDYTDSSGNAIITFDDPIESGEVTLCVSKYNKIPYISTIDVLAVDFSWTPAYPNTGNPVDFTDESELSVQSRLWDFGDGQTSTQANPSHSYNNDNTYTVTLTITTPSYEEYSVQKDIVVKTNWEPIAVALPESYAGNDPVVFFDASNSWDPDGTISSYLWDFDDGSTSDEITPTHTFSGDGIYDVSLTVFDNGGENGIDVSNIIIDAFTPPVTHIEIDGELGNDAWYISPVKVKLVGTNWSGIQTTFYNMNGEGWHEYTQPIRIWDSGETIIEYYSVDIYGNEEFVKTDSLRIDKEAPTLEVNFIGDITDSWYTSAVQVSCMATDEMSGPSMIMYSLNEERWIEYEDPFNIEENGKHLLRVYSEDVAGNTFGKSNPHQLWIDTQAPDTTVTLTGESFENMFYQEVLVNLSSVDNGSGVNNIFYRIDENEWNEYTQSFIVDDLGNHRLEYYATDHVDHMEDTKEVTFSISNINFQLSIVKPQKGLYVFDNIWFYTERTFIFGPISIEVELQAFSEASEALFDEVNILIDGELQESLTDDPLVWTWSGGGFGAHEIRIEAWNNGDSVSDVIEVIRIL